MSLVDQIAQSKKGLKKTETVVRTKEGKVFKERLDDNGNVVKDDKESQVDFIPIEAAPDPQICGPLTCADIPVPPFVFLGSQEAAVNIDGLTAKGVTHILNVATGITNAFPEKFIYKNVEILDVEETPIINYFDPCFAFIEECISNKTGVLVHCNAGVSRSASIVIAYIMYSQKIPFKTAYDMVKNIRPRIQPNPGFVDQLKHYEKNFMPFNSN